MWKARPRASDPLSPARIEGAVGAWLRAFRQSEVQLVLSPPFIPFPLDKMPAQVQSRRDGLSLWYVLLGIRIRNMALQDTR